MASLTIRKLDDVLKARLRVRAARHGRSMEQEAREILRASLAAESAERVDLATAIRRHIEPLGGVELTLPRRQPMRKPTRNVRHFQHCGVRIIDPWTA